ncbi:MAG TPA: hypothetical protein VNZ25_03980 [Candidatus Angelobacter sp.]|nr:hypothetical protein [Candidatus Angelobacter sp.]
MNETNLPENTLRSWHPRQPSAGLKRGIFPNARQTLATPRWLWGALTPTMACLMLTMIMLNSGNTGLHQKPLVTMILSNDGAPFGVSDDGQGAENQLASVTFDWTNHTIFNSSMRFTPTTNLSN